MIIGKTKFYSVWKSSISKCMKKRRLFHLLSLTDCLRNEKIRLLEIGCGNGKDAVQFLENKDRYELFGVDIADFNIQQDNFTFVQCDAENLPFENKTFDMVISIGVLEHIEPLDKLCRMIKEIDRVAKNYAIVIPSLMTVIEPHTLGLLWPLRLHNRMIHKNAKSPLKLNFFSEHTWTQFEGFQGADVKRKWYLPPFVLNTIVYKKDSTDF